MSEDHDQTPYQLPLDVTRTLLDLAAETDFLLFGEVHGTQEVPRVVAGLLDSLGDLGYSALALEVPHHDRSSLSAYGRGAEAAPPMFFSQPTPDGRGNREVLCLVRTALLKGWHVLCFDQGAEQPGREWRERDAWMARNLGEQHRASCSGGRVLAISGDLHSRITDTADGTSEFWPSFAAYLQDQHPDKRVASVAIVFHGGAYYNMEVRPVRAQLVPISGIPEIRKSDWRGHTIELHLPHATPATFLSTPRMPH